MAQGDGDAGDGGGGSVSDIRAVSRLIGRDWWKVILIAVAFGGTSGLVTKAPDRWTGTDQKEYARAVDKRLDRLEAAQALDDDHRKKARFGYERIEECEQKLAALEAKCEDSREDIRDLRERR